MPRKARERSETGIYHVMLKGIDKKDIFAGKQDYEKFLYYVNRAMEISKFEVYGYCLMPNHVHILLKEGTEKIGDAIRRIAVGYAQYFNIKYGRNGHLFQNRFRSEPVNDDVYFLIVLRYIHQNPIKANMVINMEEYEWSSYNEYIMKSKREITNIKFAMELFSNIKNFKKFMMERNKDKCLEYNERIRYTDKELEKMIMSIIDISKLKELDKETRDEVLREIKNVTKASNRQLSNVTGIGRGIWEKV